GRVQSLIPLFRKHIGCVRNTINFKRTILFVSRLKSIHYQLAPYWSEKYPIPKKIKIFMMQTTTNITTQLSPIASLPVNDNGENKSHPNATAIDSVIYRDILSTSALREAW